MLEVATSRLDCYCLSLHLFLSMELFIPCLRNYSIDQTNKNQSERKDRGSVGCEEVHYVAYLHLVNFFSSMLFKLKGSRVQMARISLAI